MWESRRDFQRVWEEWEAGFMAFHAFHTLSFPWPAFRSSNAVQTDIPPPSSINRTRYEMLIGTHRLLLSAMAIMCSPINFREVGLAFYLPTSESHREPDTVTVPIL
jgi:hypothetical protein